MSILIVTVACPDCHRSIGHIPQSEDGALVLRVGGLGLARLTQICECGRVNHWTTPKRTMEQLFSDYLRAVAVTAYS